MRTMMTLLLLGLLAAGCGYQFNAENADREIEDAFLTPLAEAELEFEVVSVCHYERTEGEKWHLSAAIDIAADPDAVRAALSDTVDVISADSSPVNVQQYAGQPGRGWNGVLDAGASGGSTLGLTMNNVVVDGDRPPIGWMPVCDF